MKVWRRHPVFWSALLATGAAIAGEGAWLLRETRSAHRAAARLSATRRELHELLQQAPAPTPENAANISADLDRARARVAVLEADLAGGEGNDLMNNDGGPQQGTDTYFELARFVAAMRERAEQLGIQLRPEEYFGFAEFAHAGPAPASAPRVERERRAARVLIESLFATAPKRLVALQRERWADTDAGPDVARAAAAADDCFAPDPGLSVRSPGVVEATGLRVTFDADTETLRLFLSRLGRSRRPLIVVQSVEVSPLEETEEELPQTVTPGGPMLLVRASLSRFVVTVEVVELVKAVQPSA